MAAVRDSSNEGETDVLPIPNMKANLHPMQGYHKSNGVFKKLHSWIPAPIEFVMIGIIVFIVFSVLQQQAGMGPNHEQDCEQIYTEDGLLINSCITEEPKLNGNTNKTTEAIIITDVYVSSNITFENDIRGKNASCYFDAFGGMDC